MAWSWDNFSNRFGDLFGGSTNYFQTNPLQGRDYGSSGYMDNKYGGINVVPSKVPPGYDKPTLADIASAGKRGETARLLAAGEVPEKGFLEGLLSFGDDKDAIDVIPEATEYQKSKDPNDALGFLVGGSKMVGRNNPNVNVSEKQLVRNIEKAKGERSKSDRLKTLADALSNYGKSSEGEGQKPLMGPKIKGISPTMARARGGRGSPTKFERRYAPTWQELEDLTHQRNQAMMNFWKDSGLLSQSWNANTLFS